MLGDMFESFPLMVPGLALFLVYRPPGKRRPTLAVLMVSVAVMALGLASLVERLTPWTAVNFAILYSAYLYPFALIALYAPADRENQLAVAWFLASLLLASAVLG